MSKRPCAVPGCPVLGETTRCPAHTSEKQKAYDQQRGTRIDRGYGPAHVGERARWQAKIDRGERVHCWRCGRQLQGRLWHLGHADEDRSVYRGPECISCNLSAAGKARHR